VSGQAKILLKKNGDIEISGKAINCQRQRQRHGQGQQDRGELI